MIEQDYEALSKGISRDMSPEAIAKRIRIAAELRDLARLLSTARRVGGVDPPPTHDGGDEPRCNRSAGGGSTP